ncbi:hypothetical protein BdWA1_002973 [Babesia duncani]|uniref:Uncharacterized protein n=1 Tax=Babesia duncani TaxID=323732 RepID=A0AAD9PIE9_9APIC|nr:hypothetical protein BdWA1_002973 [Babesia duncani]
MISTLLPTSCAFNHAHSHLRNAKSHTVGHIKLPRQYKTYKRRIGFLHHSNVKKSLGIQTQANAKRQEYDLGLNKTPPLILGGDIERPPGILGDLETPESKKIATEVWNEGGSLEEAVARINALGPMEDDSVMDNFLYGNSTLKQEPYDDLDINASTTSASNTAEEDPIENGEIKEVNDIPPGIVSQPEYVDIQDELNDLNDGYERSFNEHAVMDPINLGSLSENEWAVLRNMMKEKIENGTRDKTQTSLYRDVVYDEKTQFTLEERLGFFDKFDTVSNFLLDLNQSMNRHSLDVEWIFMLEDDIRNYLVHCGCDVAQIEWMPTAILITLNYTGLSEHQISEIQNNLHGRLQTLATRMSFFALSRLGILVEHECT